MATGRAHIVPKYQAAGRLDSTIGPLMRTGVIRILKWLRVIGGVTYTTVCNRRETLGLSKAVRPASSALGCYHVLIGQNRGLIGD
jgi:hypothetical protein